MARLDFATLTRTITADALAHPTDLGPTLAEVGAEPRVATGPVPAPRTEPAEIGRASCRERV